MPYPVATFSSLPDPPRPEYKMIDGKIARASNQFVDMVLCQVLPAGEPIDVEPPHLVWRLIERYSDIPLAKLLFLLPSICEASEAAKQNKAAILVIERMLIQVYKGIENVLFGVYEDLPEGGRLSDKAIEKKLNSLLTSPGFNS